MTAKISRFLTAANRGSITVVELPVTVVELSLTTVTGSLTTVRDSITVVELPIIVVELPITVVEPDVTVVDVPAAPYSGKKRKKPLALIPRPHPPERSELAPKKWPKKWLAPIPGPYPGRAGFRDGWHLPFPALLRGARGPPEVGA